MQSRKGTEDGELAAQLIFFQVELELMLRTGFPSFYLSHLQAAYPGQISRADSSTTLA